MIINAIAIANGGSGGTTRPPVLEELNVTDNGTFTPSTGVDGFNPVNVDVQPNLQTKSVEITSNGQSTVVADSEYYGLKTVNLNVEVQLPKIKVQGNIGDFFKKIIPDENKYLDVRMFDVSEVTGLEGAFSETNDKYNYIDTRGWNTANATTVGGAFAYCYGISELDLSHWKVNKSWNTGMLFHDCHSLVSVNISGWNLENTTNVLQTFSNCPKLTDLNMNGAILPKINLSGWGLDTSKALTVDSLVSVLNALPQLNDGESYTCPLGADNLAKLTDEQKAIATNKGWTLN